MFKALTLALVLLITVSCNQSSVKKPNPTKEKKESIVAFDLDKIKERGYLVALMENSSTGLFIYKGNTMGYEYDLLKWFCEEQGLELRIKIIPNLEQSFELLNQGEGDLIAKNLTVTKERQKIIDFTEYHHLQRQVLVQRRPQNWRRMKLHEIEEQLIRNQIDLIGKEVHVKPASAFVDRLANLSNELGGDIITVLGDKDSDVEMLIKMVSEGEIDYTIAEEDIALVNSRYYQNLDVKTPVSFRTKIAWGLRKNSPLLKEALDEWIRKMRKKVDYYTIFDKYFKSTRSSLRRVKSDFISLKNGQISPYDSLIRDAADTLGWDWLLLAAQIHKESKFDKEAKSWMGAVGLMQILPSTAKEYGITNLTNPRDNIYAGTRHLMWLQKNLKQKVDSLDLKQFVLASYNVGMGHVNDAIRLTDKYGGNPKKWMDVREYLLKKASEKYYSDPVVKYGYCRGTEPVNYVDAIMEDYQRYMDIIGERNSIPDNETLEETT